MQLNLQLTTTNIHSIVPANYQYPLSAVIYKILDREDSHYAAFLHDKGYTQQDSLKSFKLFSFSDLKTPFKINDDRLQLLTQNAQLIVSFHLPQAAENFVKGLFMDQRIEIADKRSKAIFTITQVETLPVPLTQDKIQEVVLQPLSPVVCETKNEKDQYNFLSPEHLDFVRMLMHNWKEKYVVLYGREQMETDFKEIGMEVMFFKNPPKSRLITIKADTPAETKIRGWVNYRLKVHGGKEALELLLNAGIGAYNSLGMGSVEVRSN